MSDLDYKVGYKRPPELSRFKKGFSGNPSGRPKGSKNTLNLLEKMLEQKITVAIDGKMIKISKKEALLMQCVNSAIKGNFKALQTLLPQMYMIDAKNREDSDAENLSISDEQIISKFLEEHKINE